MRYNEKVAIDLGITLEEDYVLSKIEDMQNTYIVRDGDKGSFTFSLTDLFKRCPMVFKQVDDIQDKEDIKKIYDTNKKKFQKMIKASLGKAIIRTDVKRKKDGKKESYFKFNKTTMTVLKNGYPIKTVNEFTDKEKLIIKELHIDTINKSLSSQLESMDYDLLKDSIEIAKECNILDYPYVRSIYNNLIMNEDNKKATSVETTNDFEVKNNNSNFNNNITQEQNICNKKTESNKKENNNINKRKRVNTRFHNINESFSKYTPDELEKLLQESQKNKFKKV